MAGIFEEINNEVKQAVATQSQGLRAVVVAELAGEDVKKRKELLISGIRKFAELKKELNKASKPDVVQHRLSTITGEPEKVEHFSDAAMKKFKETKDKLAKLDAALAKAVNEADFEALKKAVGNAPQSDEKAEAAE